MIFDKDGTLMDLYHYWSNMVDYRVESARKKIGFDLKQKAEIMLAMGKVPLTSGSWKDGVLAITFPYTGGEPVSMGGTIQDGKLVGVFDYNSGEIQGTWTAERK